MEHTTTLSSIKTNIQNHVGQRVTLKANNGRKKYVVKQGTIEKAYPSIFLIRLESDTQRTVTFSYSDVLTRTVQLVFA
ncbi:Veg family protein [Clostridium cellulovorans]|uniref:Veg protein n=1 Tax=Clostridium cellulovorans (strain ATCC 35296 / DSM 3052 / OCM 3 / 743B) TaxID=573061 RepID=D9STQ3_CLOC7|nr:Veg family protein [Clostridium cellulovorans]ADL52787.1 protein of unknown function DUF1021 [Clostridium cellulovorans 743B]